MRRDKLWLCASLAICAGIGIAAQSRTAERDQSRQTGTPAAADLVVHEWGTFLAMSGSDGASLEGMYHEEHALPPFVHARSRDQLRLPSMLLKGETPVIYFYTGKPQKVQVTARFPHGIWTQWYPQAQVVGPQLSATPVSDDLRNGRITWCAEVLPATRSVPTPPPPAAAKDALWNFARDVDAAFVRTPDGRRNAKVHETERFLFYRGLGRAQLPLRVTTDDSRSLVLDCNDPQGLSHVFVLHVAGGRGAYTYVPAVRPGMRTTALVPSLDDARPLPEFSARLADELAGRLVESGLYAKEARAMVNTWRTSYFQTDGIRLLFVLPRATTDALIPLSIDPQPRELVRVMVGRLEVLTPQREQAAEAAVRALTSSDSAARQHAYDYLREQGRYVEPIVRRVLDATPDPALRTKCRRLLLSDFVTELKAAVHSSSNGAHVEDDPVYVRAQLAALLRELGLNDEARAEGTAADAALRARPEPPLERSEARSHLRALARAAEGMGDDREAAARYARFIRFGSQVATNGQCIGCHQGDGPRAMLWYRDWWAGRKYAEALARAGAADKSIADQEKTLAANPGDTTARMTLAYLYAARGKTAEARALWAVLCSPGREANAE